MSENEYPEGSRGKLRRELITLTLDEYRELLEAKGELAAFRRAERNTQVDDLQQKFEELKRHRERVEMLEEMANLAREIGAKESTKPRVKTCEDCGYEIPIPSPAATQVWCPKCGKHYVKKASQKAETDGSKETPTEGDSTSLAIPFIF